MISYRCEDDLLKAIEQCVPLTDKASFPGFVKGTVKLQNSGEQFAFHLFSPILFLFWTIKKFSRVRLSLANLKIWQWRVAEKFANSTPEVPRNNIWVSISSSTGLQSFPTASGASKRRSWGSVPKKLIIREITKTRQNAGITSETSTQRKKVGVTTNTSCLTYGDLIIHKAHAEPHQRFIDL